MTLAYHRMQLPREVIVGNGTMERVPEVCRRLGFAESALVIAGSKRTFNIAGRTVKELLEDEKVEVNTLILETATIADVEAAEEKIKELKPQIVFGVGGGTRIDIAKCSSARQDVPFVSVPTTASHDGIASPFSSIRGFETPYSVMAQAPVAIIADTNIITQAPWRLTVSGCGDVISKLTAVKDWKLAHADTDEYYGGYAASLALMSTRLIMENADLISQKGEEGLRIVIEALISCGVAMSIAGSSRPCSGSEHIFCHAFDLVKPNHAMHGELCGVGTIMMAYLHRANWKRVKTTLEKLEAPTNATDLGVENEDVLRSLEMAITLRPERYTILNKLNLNRETLEKLAIVTQVIRN